MYLQSNFGLGFEKPASETAADAYVSDPAKPGALSKPGRFILGDSDRWRNLAGYGPEGRGRPDRRADLRDAETDRAPCASVAHRSRSCFAATTGTDADWVVKLIDVFPGRGAEPARSLGGYQLSISMDILRGRYRESYEHPSPIPAGKTAALSFCDAHHESRISGPGHRIMVQIQSSWFPLYDRNPQTYVPNIFMAQPADYMKATHSVYRSGG